MSDIGLRGLAGLILLLAGLAVCLAALIVAVVVALLGANRHPRGFRGAFARVGAGPLAALLAALLAIGWTFVGSNETVDDASPYLLIAIAIVGVIVALVARRRSPRPPDRLPRDQVDGDGLGQP